MSESFSLFQSACSPIGDPSLKDEIDRHTRNDAETSQILRSIERFGGDDSIRRYDISLHKGRRSERVARTAPWNVRAVR